MLDESVIHKIHIFGGTHRGIHNTQTRSQNKSKLTAVYIAYIDKKWDHNEKENEKNPHDADKSPQ